jgi:hypothetical protein
MHWLQQAPTCSHKQHAHQRLQKSAIYIHFKEARVLFYQGDH